MLKEVQGGVFVKNDHGVDAIEGAEKRCPLSLWNQGTLWTLEAFNRAVAVDSNDQGVAQIGTPVK